MHQRIAFVKTGWSEEYKGGSVTGRAAFIARSNNPNKANELFNFQKGLGGKYYGYIPPLGPHQSSPQPGELDDWLLIFIAARNGDGPLTVVGWYEEAEFEQDYQARPEYTRGQDFPTDDDGENYYYCVSTKLAHLIPVEERKIIIPGDHFRRASIVYVKGNKDKGESWRKDLAKIAENICNSNNSSKGK